MYKRQVLFAVLPYGVRQPEEKGEGHMGGAPENPNVKKKFIATAVISAVIWCIIALLIEMKIVDFHAISQEMFKQDFGE